MNQIGGKPIVIGGKDPNGTIYGIVEIFHEASGQWIFGPSLALPRRGHSTVVLNETTLVVIGGYRLGFLNLVELFDLNKMEWKCLDNLPNPTSEMACGMLNGTFILCIGGEKDKNPGTTETTTAAYGLDMSTNNARWTEQPMFNVPNPVKTGFIFLLRDYLYCITLEPVKNQQKMRLRDTNPTWEMIQDFQNHPYTELFPFVIRGLKIIA